MNASRLWNSLPWVAGIAAFAAFGLWLLPDDAALKLRIPGTDAAPGGETGSANPVLAGKLIPGAGKPGELPWYWPQFRGPQRDGIASPHRNPTGATSLSANANPPAPALGPPLSRDWKTAAPREVWSLELGEGYAGPAVAAGRVFIFDYDRDARQSALRCLSLADGQEIWQYRYPLTIKRNHGMTRTVPAVTDELVVALDSKCNLFALSAATGELRWSLNLVHEFGTTVPDWYAGQCPLVEGDQVILAPGGKDALLAAIELDTGKPIWRTPNPHGWKMTHSSVMPMDFAGWRQYLYCANKGVVGVDAKSGAPLWETTDWKISIATVPSPVPLPDGRIFLTGGYGAGSLMLQLVDREGQIIPQTVWRIEPEVFGATQHTPIFLENHLYGARADGRFVCLGLDGQVVWASSPQENFGLGSFLVVQDQLLALNDSGLLRLFEASPAGFNLRGEVQPLSGRESWAPMALAGNHLLLRDLTRLVCLDLSAR